MSAHHTALDVGTPAREFKGWETRVIRYHGFGDLTSTKGKAVASPEFSCFGHRWQLRIFPGGGRTSDNGMVGLYLYNMSAKSIDVDFGFNIKDLDSNDVAKLVLRSDGSRLFEPVGSSGNFRWGSKNFAKRSDLLSALVAGTLIVEVRMMCTDPSTTSTPFVAENPSCDMVRKLFLDEESADVVFEVGEDGQQIQDSRKRARAGPAKFHAHRFVLKQSAPMLAALCPAGDGVVSASIADMAPEVFRPVLCYLYGGEVSEREYKSHAREIIKAADRFAIVDLKLAAEAQYVQSTEINFENVMELLLYSDAKNLALLKEVVMDFIVANGEQVLEKVSLKEAPAGLLADTLAAMARGNKKDTGGMNKLNTMRISDLRKMLHEKGLGVDGSRETLIATLEQNK